MIDRKNKRACVRIEVRGEIAASLYHSNFGATTYYHFRKEAEADEIINQLEQALKEAKEAKEFLRGVNNEN